MFLNQCLLMYYINFLSLIQLVDLKFWPLKGSLKVIPSKKKIH